GAGLYALYAQQAALAPDARIAETPGGRPTRLDTLPMPTLDGFVFVAPHPGQGALLLGSIDPSVTDESDPLSVDPDLDPLSASNGFAEPPQPSRYSPAFIDRYRAAQRARVARLDARARELIQARLTARKQAKETGEAVARRRGSHT